MRTFDTVIAKISCELNSKKILCLILSLPPTIGGYGKNSTIQPWQRQRTLGQESLCSGCAVAKRHGYHVESVNYTQQLDPDLRVQQLLSFDLNQYQEVVLIGSSMGAYVATVAAEQIKPKGLFLLAPAFYLPGYQQTNFIFPAEQTWVVHGWLDDIVPPEYAWRFCMEYHVKLTMLNADHRLMTKLPEVVEELDRFLSFIAAES